MLFSYLKAKCLINYAFMHSNEYRPEKALSVGPCGNPSGSDGFPRKNYQ